VWLCTLTFRSAAADQYADVQRWLKRVRKHSPSGTVRYTCVSELGSRNGRFHYHVVLYCQDDLKKRDLESWTLGFAHYKLVTAHHAAQYIAKYLAKGHGKVRSSQRLGVATMEKVHAHETVSAVLSAVPGAQVAKVGGTRVPRELQVAKTPPARYRKAEWDDAVSAPHEGDPPAISSEEWRRLGDIIHQQYLKTYQDEHD